MHQRHRVRVSLAALVLPFCALLLLARMEPSRRPLDEREAALAIDLQRLRRGSDAVSTETHGPWTSTTLSLVAGTPRLVGNRELQLRLPGMLAGAAAIGVFTLLGRQLFAPRVGIAMALLLLALPGTRQLLGVGLGGEPFFLLAMAIALLAIREMGRTRAAAVTAGVACGVALAVAGLDAVWLPVLALAWLRVLQGLTWRSAGVIAGTSAAIAAILLVVGWLVVGRDAGLPLLPTGYGHYAYLDPTLVQPRTIAPQLLPLVPVVLVGLGSLRSAWLRSESFRLVWLWLALATVSSASTGSSAGALVAIVTAAAAIGLLGLEHTRRLVTLPTCAIALGIAFGMWRATPPVSESRLLERWAIRETGRFVGRVIDEQRRVAADARIARRLAYYGNRRIEQVPQGTATAVDADYLVLPRDEYRTFRERRSATSAGHTAGAAPASLKRVAEFGGWVVARIAPESTGRTAHRGADSPFVRPQ
ncbi:hypothetical protein K2Z84_16800 [Candidatus Binatia bacterium]|nr:hypothetical protein [Candidatus Binatia bacterium]